MFPDVQTENSLAAARKQIRSVLIRSGVDGKFPVADDQPGPTGAKAAQAGSGKFLLKSGKGTKRRIDRRRKTPLGLSATALFHERPEERVVPVAAAVVADGVANIFWDGIEAFEQIVDGLGLQTGLTLQGLVEVGHVSAVMLVMMDLHRLGVDVRFECVKRVRQRGHSKCHGFILQSEI